jgi:hypothetical protein
MNPFIEGIASGQKRDECTFQNPQKTSTDTCSASGCVCNQVSRHGAALVARLPSVVVLLLRWAPIPTLPRAMRWGFGSQTLLLIPCCDTACVHREPYCTQGVVTALTYSLCTMF